MKWIGILFVLIALSMLVLPLWVERRSLQLLFSSDTSMAVIVSVHNEGQVQRHPSRYNLHSDLPQSVTALRVEYRFDTDQGPWAGETRLDYFELQALLEPQAMLETDVLRGRSVPVRYRRSDPELSQIVHPLPWEGFWMPLMSGIAFAIIGILFMNPPRDPAASEPTE